MDLLQPSELELTGRWLESDGNVIADSICERINWLVNNHLQKHSVSKCGWDVLFIDPTDGRYWLLSYPQSHWHGGGPPDLKVVSIENFNNIKMV